MSFLYADREGIKTETEHAFPNRFERNELGDLKHGLDLIYALKKQLDMLHPTATYVLKRILAI